MKLNQLTIKQAQEGLTKKKFSSLELTKACLNRIKQVDKKIKAFITVAEEEAIKTAKKADQLLAQNNKDVFKEKSLLGIPFSMKEPYCTKDVRTTASSNVLKDYVPTYNATVAKKLLDDGAILLGKENCDAWGHGSSTENSDFGPTRNPWNIKYVPGGSSGGPAAAITSGMSLFSIGEDTGGSIRLPACFCNIVGLKPTYGRVSRYGTIAYASSLDTVGPMAKTIEGIAIILNIIAGKDPFDATSSLKTVPNYFSLLKKKLRGMKIGLPKEFFEKGIEPEVKRAVLSAVKKIQKLGVKFEEVSLPSTKYAIATYYLVATSETSSNLARYDGMRYGFSRSRFGAEAKRRIMLGTYALSAGYYDAYYLKGMQMRTLIKKEFNEVFKKVDCLITPVSPTPPFKLGEKVDDPLTMYLSDILTVTANLAGVPALALPCGFTKDNLPIGMQIIGPQFSEDLLLRVGYAYEQETEWHKMRPEITK